MGVFVFNTFFKVATGWKHLLLFDVLCYDNYGIQVFPQMFVILRKDTFCWTQISSIV